MGDIGEPLKTIEFEPLPERGLPEPERTPAPAPVPEEVPA